MHLFSATVTSNLPITADALLMSLAVPEAVWKSSRSGQFFHIKCAEGADPLLRRPISLYSVDEKSGEISIMVRPAGKGTAWLGRRHEGDEIDVLGPLGRPFRLESRTRHVLLLAGGIGVAPLVAAASEAIKQGAEVLLIAGAASADKLLPVGALPSEVEYRVATDDGSIGHHGFVTDLLDGTAQWADQIFACGPSAMFATLAGMKKAGKLGRIDVQVSLERHMGCGLGACLGCVVPCKVGYRRVCADGPVFGLEEVRW